MRSPERWVQVWVDRLLPSMQKVKTTNAKGRKVPLKNSAGEFVMTPTPNSTPVRPDNRAWNLEAELGDLPTVVLQTERFIDVQVVAIVRLAALAKLTLSPGLLPRVTDELCAVAGARHTYPPANSWRHGSRGTST